MTNATTSDQLFPAGAKSVQVSAVTRVGVMTAPRTTVVVPRGEPDLAPMDDRMLRATLHWRMRPYAAGLNGHYLDVPSPTLLETEGTRAYWIVPPERSGVTGPELAPGGVL